MITIHILCILRPSTPAGTCSAFFIFLTAPRAPARRTAITPAHECMHGRDGYVTLRTFTGSIRDAHQEPMVSHEKRERIFSLIFFLIDPHKYVCHNPDPNDWRAKKSALQNKQTCPPTPPLSQQHALEIYGRKKERARARETGVFPRASCSFLRQFYAG